jgi:nitrogen regulatory protein P-II 1
MKEIKAYVHANRIAEVIAALKDSAAWGTVSGANPHNLTVYIVKGSLVPIDDRERQYSMELGDEVVNEYKLELLCDEAHVDELVAIVRAVARTGQANAGWVYVTDVQQALPIG